VRGADGVLPAVVVVERRAHERLGHYPVLFAEVAEGFAALGCRVTMLTAHGWCLETERATPCALSTYGHAAAVLDGLAQWLRQMSWRGRRGWLGRLAGMLQVVVMTREAAATARRLGGDTVVVVVADVDAPALIAAFAGRGRWLIHTYLAPRHPPRAIWLRVDRVVERLARAAEWFRRRIGGCCVVAVPSDVLWEKWARVAETSGLRLVITLQAGGGSSSSIPNAREQLGIDGSYKVALLFGASYDEKDPATVFEAFSRLDEWHLIVAGGMAAQIPPTARVLRAYPGFVDERTRELLYSSANLLVISFHPGFDRNSGTLRDAITWSIPVVCSEQPQLVEVVTKYKLGTVFRPGDASSLVRAVRAAPDELDPVQLARAQSERSYRITAQQALDAVGVTPDVIDRRDTG